MAKLSAKERDRLPAKDFALGKGRYPINDRGHAKAALARVSEHGTPAEKKEVASKVKRKFPGMVVKGGSYKQRAKRAGKSTISGRKK